MDGETWIVAGPQVIDIDTDVRSLKASIIGGQLSVIAHDEPTTRIEVHELSGRPLEITLTEAGELTVGYPFVNWENFLEKFKSFVSRESAIVSLMVPRALTVKLGTVSGAGLLAGTDGGVSASTVSGRVSVDSVHGDLKLGTVSGSIDCRAVTGAITANSVSGMITAAGEINSVSVNTVSGDVLLDTSASTCVVKVDGVSSNVTVRRPAATAVSAKVSTISGVVIIDNLRYGKGHGRTVVEVPANTGALAWLQVTTVSGDVTVLGAPAGHAGTEESSTGTKESSQ